MKVSWSQDQKPKPQKKSRQRKPQERNEPKSPHDEDAVELQEVEPKKGPSRKKRRKVRPNNRAATAYKKAV